jgi:hypothetical protein
VDRVAVKVVLSDGLTEHVKLYGVAVGVVLRWGLPVGLVGVIRTMLFVFVGHDDGS